MFSEFRKNIPTAPAATEDDSFAIGKKLLDDGLEAKHPVVFIPGLVSSALEVWNTPARPVSIEHCRSQSYFRKVLGNLEGSSNSFLLPTQPRQIV